MAASSTRTRRRPFENPTALDQLALDLPALGDSLRAHLHLRQDGAERPARGDAARRDGAALRRWVAFTSYAEHQDNPAVAAAGITSQPTGNMEGKEVRFGDTTTALFGVSSTMTSTGSADASYDSFTPIGGLGLLTGMMLGEVTPGGIGQWALHDPHLRHHRRVHRRVDDRTNAGVPRVKRSRPRRSNSPASARSSCRSSF